MESIYYAHFKVPTGYFWVASSNKGIVQASIHKSKEVFVEILKKRIKGTPIYALEKFAEVEKQVKEYFEGKRKTFSFTFDLRGTEFQMAVWREIANIPLGHLTSYSNLAKAAGSPKAVRAAGSATGANPIGLLIPCHRVIRSDGGLGGFGGGLPLKRQLLENEGILEKGKITTKKELLEFIV